MSQDVGRFVVRLANALQLKTVRCAMSKPSGVGVRAAKTFAPSEIVSLARQALADDVSLFVYFGGRNLVLTFTGGDALSLDVASARLLEARQRAQLIRLLEAGCTEVGFCFRSCGQAGWTPPRDPKLARAIADVDAHLREGTRPERAVARVRRPSEADAPRRRRSPKARPRAARDPFWPARRVATPSRITLVFDDFGPTEEAFRRAGRDGGGHAWGEVLTTLLGREAPELLPRLFFDPEASELVVTSDDEADLHEVARWIKRLHRDKNLLALSLQKLKRAGGRRRVRKKKSRRG